MVFVFSHRVSLELPGLFSCLAVAFSFVIISFLLSLSLCGLDLTTLQRELSYGLLYGLRPGHGTGDDVLLKL